MDYNQTVHLPQTDFPMRAGLPKREPEMLQEMYDHDLYHKMVKRNEGKPTFVLHDGPPYANGNIHIGTALNKILKDMIVKHRNMTGWCAPYVPGWDTHGLPIESAVLKDKKVKRDEMTTAQFRTKCREYAESYIEKMTGQFQRLGVLGEWYLLPAILLLGTQIASAQSILKDKDDKELSVLLNEVVITGTGTEHYLKDAPVQTEVITSKALEQYQARSIDDLLSGLSPSLTFHDGDMGSHIQLNGLNNDYILIMINGKRMNGDVGGQNDLNQLNPANIERIEIVKGAASSLYGSDAIAGVINIITKRNREKMELTNTSRIGEYGDIRQSTSFGFNYGIFPRYPTPCPVP